MVLGLCFLEGVQGATGTSEFLVEEIDSVATDVSLVFQFVRDCLLLFELDWVLSD